jgi:hypothetical protein
MLWNIYDYLSKEVMFLEYIRWEKISPGSPSLSALYFIKTAFDQYLPENKILMSFSYALIFTIETIVPRIQ